jgi:hypothetical protein
MYRMLMILLLATTVAGCGSTKVTPVGATYEAREPDCQFDLYTTVPGGNFIEIGTVDVNPGSYGHNVHTKLDGFKKEIQPHVCQVGGDAAIAYANGYGMWIKASILKRVAGAPAAQSTGNDTGCSNDTQCKGDRICEEGRCVNP